MRFSSDYERQINGYGLITALNATLGRYPGQDDEDLIAVIPCDWRPDPNTGFAEGALPLSAHPGSFKSC
ncbi:hypothetical protein [Sinorhizobium arboris]|uniref:hypothetical protein n=1 Tax=Sinorhizobium arboris TaxID=76745 RepID=UPI0004060544|nr:hypothetical protein [Sinorhizobium arboris]